MNILKTCKSLFVCTLALGCMIVSTKAVDISSGKNIHIRELRYEVLTSPVISLPQTRAFGTVDVSISPNSTSAASKTLSLDAGESVRIDCSYSPASASVDFGLIAPDGRFYYQRKTNGSVDTKITVDERGNYTFVIRNNSSETVHVIGNIHY